MSTQTIELAHATGGVSDTHLKNSTPIGFDTFCTRLAETTPKPGPKDGAYFVRGPVNGNATRSDANIIRADVVILDGDSSTTDNGTTEKGAPCPSLVHEALKGADIAHAIYTSYSHTPESPRYRVIVPCRMESKQELTAVVEWLIDLLHRESVPLAAVSENLAWAQAWYYPRLAGTDSQYLTYSHDTDERLNLVAIMDWHAERHEPPPARPTSAVQGDTPWNQYNAKHGTPEAMGALLEARGYIAKGTGKINGTEAYRFLHPSSQTGSPGVRLFKGRHGKWLVSSSHGGDVLNDGHTHDAFSLFTVLNQGGDTKAAVAAPTGAQAPSLDLGEIPLGLCAASVAPRPWVCEGRLLRGTVSILAGYPGSGKTSFELASAVSVATGVSYTGEKYRDPGKAWIYANEEDTAELHRRYLAFCIHFGIEPSSLRDRLRLSSGYGRSLVVATQTPDGVIQTPIVDLLIPALKEWGCTLFAPDPIVSTHRVNENSNSDAEAVMDTWRYVASETGCAIDLTSHTPKGQDDDSEAMAGNMGAVRGAGALVGAARNVHTLCKMSTATAKKYGIDRSIAGGLIRLDPAKNNYSPDASEALWLRIAGVCLDNDPEYPDWVGVVGPYTEELVEVERDHKASDQREESLEALRVAVMRLGIPQGRSERVRDYLDEMASFSGLRQEWVRKNVIFALKRLDSAEGQKAEYSWFKDGKGAKSPIMIHHAAVG